MTISLFRPEALPPYLSAEIEGNIKQFLNEAEDIGIPRMKRKCAEDIQAYVTQANISVPYVDNKPGMEIKLVLLITFSKIAKDCSLLCPYT